MGPTYGAPLEVGDAVRFRAYLPLRCVVAERKRNPHGGWMYRMVTSTGGKILGWYSRDMLEAL